MLEINSTKANEPSSQANRTANSGTDGRSTFLAFLTSARKQGFDNGLGKANNPQNCRETDRKTSNQHANTDSDKTAGSAKENDLRQKSRREDEITSERPLEISHLRSGQRNSVIFDVPVRMVLHVVDFERIISSIRTQKAEGLSSVVINLKHSVFDGLELRITFKEGRGLAAEFIALNEAVKSAIESRSAELIQMFSDRGVKLTSLDVSVGSDGQNNFDDSGKDAPASVPARNGMLVGQEAGPEPRFPAYTGTSYLT